MTLRDRILTFLAALPEGAKDTDIERALAVKHHAQVNQRCRELAAAGLIERRNVGPGRYRNYHLGAAIRHAPSPTQAPTAVPEKPWYWEGNVQSKVVRYLVENGWDITRVADTASREAGRDVTAAKNGNELWVSVKGRPEGTERTTPATQGRVWFHGAIFDLICWRGESDKVELMMALPEFVTYRNLASRIQWLAETARFQIAWVQQDGTVSV